MNAWHYDRSVSSHDQLCIIKILFSGHSRLGIESAGEQSNRRKNNRKVRS